MTRKLCKMLPLSHTPVCAPFLPFKLRIYSSHSRLRYSNSPLISQRIQLIVFQTVSVVATFVLVMVLDPEIQKRAQAELDGVISGRLPTLADQVSLPYVTAVVYETFRWKASSPLGKY